MEQKTFYKALVEVNLRPEMTKKYLFDKRLTQAEKTLIEVFLLIRNNSNVEAIRLIESISKSPFTFVNAIKDFFHGIALNNTSEFVNAEASILKSLPVFESLSSHYFSFTGRFNLFFIYINNHQYGKAEEMMRSMSEIPMVAEIQTLRLLRCQFIYFSETDHTKEASAVLIQIENKKNLMGESDRISHLIDVFTFYLKQDNFDYCVEVLNEMKNFRKFHLTENYKFMKKLLYHLTDNAPIYLKTNEFNSTLLIDYQMRVIHALEERDEQTAKTYWDKLSLLSPEIYLRDFKYSGPKSLFSLCLEKHTKKRLSVLPGERLEETSHLDILVDLLKNSTGPLPKGYIYEIIWGAPPSTKDDLKKLSRLMSIARNKRNLIVHSRKGTYLAAASDVHDKKRKA